MNGNQTCCAHCNVVLKHKDYPDGTRNDYWECVDNCGMAFWPVSHSNHLKEQISSLENQVLELREALRMSALAPNSQTFKDMRNELLSNSSSTQVEKKWVRREVLE